MCQGAGPSPLLPTTPDSGAGDSASSQPPRQAARAGSGVALVLSQDKTLAGLVTLGKSLPPVSLSFLPGRADSSRGSALPTPQEGAAQRVRKRFVRRSARRRSRGSQGLPGWTKLWRAWLLPLRGTPCPGLTLTPPRTARPASPRRRTPYLLRALCRRHRHSAPRSEKARGPEG